MNDCEFVQTRCCLKTVLEEVSVYYDSCNNGSPDVIHHVLHMHTAHLELVPLQVLVCRTIKKIETVTTHCWRPSID